MTDPSLDPSVLHELIAALPDVVILVGEDRTIRFINRSEAGYDKDEVIGSPVEEFIAEDAREGHAALLDHVFETADPGEYTTEIVGAGGQPEWYAANLIPLVTNGQVTSVAIVSTNVTARVQAERELAMLRTLLPVCAWCRRIRLEDGTWQTLEVYLEDSGKGRVTHGMCPDCAEQMDHEARKLAT